MVLAVGDQLPAYSRTLISFDRKDRQNKPSLFPYFTHQDTWRGLAVIVHLLFVYFNSNNSQWFEKGHGTSKHSKTKKSISGDCILKKKNHKNRKEIDWEPLGKVYLKGRNFCRKKILQNRRILAKFVKLNSFFAPRKCRFAEIDCREILKIDDSWNVIPAKFFKNWWTAKIVSIWYNVF